VEAPGAGRSGALWSAAAIAAILAAFVLVRLPLLTRQASVRGWNGDISIFGLMAKKIRDGRGVDVYYWGQNYMGPLTPAVAAAIRRTVLDPAGFGADGAPIALRLAGMSQTAFGICFFVLGLTRLFGRTIAAAAGVWMALGPPFFVHLSVVPRGPEMAFAIGSVLFFLAAGVLTRPVSFLDRPAGRFVFGLLAGFGWWMNQTVAFILLPAAVVLLVRAERRGMGLVAPLLCGAAIGYAPVWMGRLFGWYELHLGTVVPPWRLSGLPGRLLRFLSADSWRFVGLEGILPAPLMAGAALLLLSLFVLRRPRPGALAFAGAIAGLAAAVLFLKDLDPTQIRYLAAALPAALALVLVGVAETTALLRRKIPAVLAAIVPGGLAALAVVFLSRQAQDTVENLLREPDPRGPLQAIVAQGFAVCHAGYDTAYTLQFLSDERVRFIPFHSPDRNRKLSAELLALPGPQCLVTDDGTVRQWLPSDAAQEGGPARRRAQRALTPEAGMLRPSP
jgi:hypothetical protein